jgi:hypothetical protein
MPRDALLGALGEDIAQDAGHEWQQQDERHDRRADQTHREAASTRVNPRVAMAAGALPMNGGYGKAEDELDDHRKYAEEVVGDVQRMHNGEGGGDQQPRSIEQR